jgi:Pectinesterase.
MTTFYLGRPWQSAPKTVYLYCTEPATVNAAGWTIMGPNPALYAEYNCSGPGYIAGRPGLAAWGSTQPTTITAGQAANYTIANIFSKNNNGNGFTYAANWLPDQAAVDLLPVELTTFTAVQSGKKTTLNWSTATEVNSAYFEVERRGGNSNQYMSIAKINAAGTSNAPKNYSYTDNSATSGKNIYRLKQVDNDGMFKYVGEAEVDILVPRVMTLANYPNPFNPQTNIQFTVREDGHALVKIFNLVGQEVACVFDGQAKAGDSYSVPFGGARFASGVYYYTLEINGSSMTKKMLLLK